MPKKRLTREQVLTAAFHLADDVGIDALSMRKLGKAVGVEAMSLYNHVKNKDDVLDGLLDLLVAEIELPRADDDWRTGMRRRVESAREVFRRHPWGIHLIETRRNPGPAQIRYYDGVLGCLRRDGFDVVGAAHAFAVLDSFLYGFALQEKNLPFESTEDLQEFAVDVAEALPADEFPHFAEMVYEHALKPDYSFAAEFDFGLELILDGLERLISTDG